MQDQSVAERHKGPGRWHGIGDADRDHDPLGPPLELAALPPQRLAKLRVVGEFEEEGVAYAAYSPVCSSTTAYKPSISPSSPVIAGIAAGWRSARSCPDLRGAGWTVADDQRIERETPAPRPARPF